MAASATSNHLALTLADSPPLPTTLETNNFFSSLKIITQSSILYFYFYICVKKRFSVLWKKSTLSHFFYPFFMKYHINLSTGWNLHFNSSICCQWHVLPLKPQHRYASKSLCQRNYQQRYTTFRQ